MITIKPVDFSPTLRAVDQLIAQMEYVPRGPLEKYGHDATSEMKEQHDRDAHAIQRYVNRTFYLSTSIGWEVQHPSDAVWRLRMFAPPWYAEAVEYGTSRSQPYPFFWIEVYAFEPAAVADLSRAFFGLLARHEASVR